MTITMQELLQEILDTSMEYIEKQDWKKFTSRSNARLSLIVAISSLDSTVIIIIVSIILL